MRLALVVVSAGPTPLIERDVVVELIRFIVPIEASFFLLMILAHGYENFSVTRKSND